MRDGPASIAGLLRSAHDPARVRIHPLVSHLRRFADVAQDDATIAAAIQAAFDQLLVDPAVARHEPTRRRLHTIVIRCDRDREPSATVARQLGLCERQLYRDKRKARRYLASYIASARRPDGSTVSVTDADEALLVAAVRLRELGQWSAALRAYDELLEHLPDERAYVALAERANTILESHGTPAGLPREHPRFQTLVASSDAQQPSQLEIVWTMACTAASRCDRVQAVRACEDIVQRLAPALFSRTRRAIELFVRANALLADSMLGRSDEDAASALQRADDALETYGPMPALRGIPLMARWERAFGNDRRSAAVSLYERCSAFARDRARIADMLYLEHSFSIIERQAGNAQSALAHAREAVTLASSQDSFPHLMTVLNLARACDLMNDERGWHDAVKRAERLAEPRPEWYPMVHAAYAEFYLNRRDFERARAAASLALPGLSTPGLERFAGVVLRVAAEASEAQGRAREAYDSIEESVDLLDRYGTNFARAQAYATSARIAKRRDHGRRAADLLASFST